MNRRSPWFLAAMLALLPLLPAIALNAAEPTATQAGRPAEVDEATARSWLLDFHRSLAKQLNKRAYAHLDDSDRQQIVKAQQRIRSLLADVDSVTELETGARTELWNEHARVVAVLAAREDQRLVCERVNKTGTHVNSMECLTVATRERMRRDAEALLRDTRTFVDTPSGN